MASGDPSARPPASRRPSRWPSARSAPRTSNRLVFRLIAIPALAVAGVLIYRGVQRALHVAGMQFCRAPSRRCPMSLAQLEVEPLARRADQDRFRAASNQVVCNVVLPLLGRRHPEHRLQFFLAGQYRRHAVFDLAQAGRQRTGGRRTAGAYAERLRCCDWTGLRRGAVPRNDTSCNSTSPLSLDRHAVCREENRDCNPNDALDLPLARLADKVEHHRFEYHRLIGFHELRGGDFVVLDDKDAGLDLRRDVGRKPRDPLSPVRSRKTCGRVSGFARRWQSPCGSPRLFPAGTENARKPDRAGSTPPRRRDRSDRDRKSPQPALRTLGRRWPRTTAPCV